MNLNYSFEFTPTETSAGGTLVYIANHLSYKCRNVLNIYKKNELESTFIVNPKESNIIVGVIYGHPSLDLTDFNCNYLNQLLENISKEQKSVFLLENFDVNLLNYNEHNQTNEFLDSLASNSFIPLILQPTKITSHSNTLKDNIFQMLLIPISKSKPWITLGLQKSISVKNKILANFINKKDPLLKEEFHTNYKKYRNLLSTLMKKSKQAYYERNWNNIKNTWKGIKSLISLKTVASSVPAVLSLDNGDTIANAYDIAYTFNNYFASIAEATKKA